MTSATVTITQLNRYPVKGLSAERLEAVDLTEEQGIPGDRLFGFARFNSGFDPANPKPLPKDRFVVLMNVAGLAGLHTRFHPQSKTLEINAPDVFKTFKMDETAQSIAAAEFLHQWLKLADPEPPRFVSSAPHRFTDVSVTSPRMMNAISVLNLASVRDFESRLDVPVHPDRFRANVVIDGVPPFAELEAVGGTLDFGDVTLRILSRTKRCAATEVNPLTAERDLKVPYLLRKELGHTDMGVYVEVLSRGALQTGQEGTFAK